MKKRLDFWIQEFKFKIIEEHCKAVGRTTTDVLRELIRSLKVRKSCQAKDRASALRYAPPKIFGESQGLESAAC